MSKHGANQVRKRAGSVRACRNTMWARSRILASAWGLGGPEFAGQGLLVVVSWSWSLWWSSWSSEIMVVVVLFHWSGDLRWHHAFEWRAFVYGARNFPSDPVQDR